MANPRNAERYQKTLDSIASNGEALYARIRTALLVEDSGRYVAIHAKTGEYIVGDSELDASLKFDARFSANDPGYVRHID